MDNHICTRKRTADDAFRITREPHEAIAIRTEEPQEADLVQIQADKGNTHQKEVTESNVHPQIEQQQEAVENKDETAGMSVEEGAVMPATNDNNKKSSSDQWSSLMKPVEEVLNSNMSARQAALDEMAKRLVKLRRFEDIDYFIRTLQVVVLERQRNIQQTQNPLPKPKAKPKPGPRPKFEAETAIQKQVASVPKSLATGRRVIRAPKDPPNLTGPLTHPRESDAEDVIYEMCRIMQSRKNVVVDNEVNIANLTWFVKQVLSVAKKDENWTTAWMQMCVPEEHRREIGLSVIHILLDCMIESRHLMKKVAQGIADLSRWQRIKMSFVQEAMCSFVGRLSQEMQRLPEAWQVISWLLCHWFPRPRHLRWGWSRVGWSWLDWWKLVERILKDMDQSVAFDVLQYMLELMQEQATAVICEQEDTGERVWSEMKLEKLREKLRNLSGGLDNDELRKKLGSVNIYGIHDLVSSDAKDPSSSSDSDSED